MSKEYEARVTMITVTPEGEDTFSDQATSVRVEDEGAGEFVVIHQEDGEVRFDPDEWPALRKAINRIVRQCR